MIFLQLMGETTPSTLHLELFAHIIHGLSTTGKNGWFFLTGYRRYVHRFEWYSFSLLISFFFSSLIAILEPSLLVTPMRFHKSLCRMPPSPLSLIIFKANFSRFLRFLPLVVNALSSDVKNKR